MSYRQLIIYGIVGVSNTLITVAAISLLTLLHTDIFVANLLGYLVGLANSFHLNQRFTFQVKGAPIPFVISFGISYLANLFVLFALMPAAAISPLLPQAGGVLVYAVSFYVLMKIWVYR